MLARRRLITLGAITRDARVRVETRVLRAPFNRVSEALRDLTQPGDAILCSAEQMVSKGWAGRRPLAQALLDEMENTICTVSNLMGEQRLTGSSWAKKIPIWTLLFVIFAGFFAFEASVGHLARSWLQQALLVGVMVAEVGAVFAWNYLGQ